MKTRIRAPGIGNEIHTFGDEATVQDLHNTITKMTGWLMYQIKYDFPLKPLKLAELPSDMQLHSIPYKLDNQLLVVEKVRAADDGFPDEIPGLPQPTTAPEAGPTPRQKQAQSRQASSQPWQTVDSLSAREQETTSSISESVERDPPSIRLTHLGGNLVLRVVPDDNSCLFHALGLCLLDGGPEAVAQLRSIVVSGIQEDQRRSPVTYTEAILGMTPDEYCAKIQRPETWGGYIDINIIAQFFTVTIVSVDVQTGHATLYPVHDATQCCYIMYSGIHYDALALSYNRDPTADIPRFDIDDPLVLEGAKKVAAKLRSQGYFTNTSALVLKCNSCSWRGGQAEAQNHLISMGHESFQEA